MGRRYTDDYGPEDEAADDHHDRLIAFAEEEGIDPDDPELAAMYAEAVAYEDLYRSMDRSREP
jgi:hypothetical protein